MRTYKKESSRVYILWILFITSLLLSSCGDKLNQYPSNAFAKDNFWTSESNALIALTGAYRGGITYGTQTVPSDWWTYCGLIFLDLATDNAYDRRGDNSTINRLTNGTLLPNNNVINGYWTGSYKRIAICNDFLENIDKVPMDPVKISRMRAEVKFLRATQYFYMSQFWGSVPLITQTLTPEEANIVDKASKAQVVDFIIKELKEAADDLPRLADIPSSEIGRASKQAALGFLGRIYLSEKRFSEASNAYREIIDLDDNIIDPDYQSLFNTQNEDSPENIFSVQFLGGQAANA